MFQITFSALPLAGHGDCSGGFTGCLKKGKLEILRTVYLLKQEYALGKLKGGENQASFMT